jgi:hypothetical protein
MRAAYLAHIGGLLYWIAREGNQDHRLMCTPTVTTAEELSAQMDGVRSEWVAKHFHSAQQQELPAYQKLSPQRRLKLCRRVIAVVCAEMLARSPM